MYLWIYAIASLLVALERVLVRANPSCEALKITISICFDYSITFSLEQYFYLYFSTWNSILFKWISGDFCRHDVNSPFWRRLVVAGDFRRALNWEKLLNFETDIFCSLHSFSLSLTFSLLDVAGVSMQTLSNRGKTKPTGWVKNWKNLRKTKLENNF